MLFAYVWRSLRKRFRANTVTILSIVLFVAGCTAGIAFYLGLKKQVVDSTPPEDVLVLARGASSESASRLPLEMANKIAVLPGIKVDGSPLVTRELLSSVGISSEGSKARATPPIRGYDAQSMKIHGIVVTGNAPAPESLEVMVGHDLLEQFPNLKVGSTLPLPAGPSPITGTFTGPPGDPVNGELWTPRSALERHTKAKQSTSMLLVADGVARVPELVTKIKESKDIEADAYSLREFRSTQAGLAKIVNVVLLMVVLLSVVAGLAISTTMSAAVSSRMPELAVFITIGFQRARLGRLVMIESLLLAMIGALVGLAASFGVAKLLAHFGQIRVDIVTNPLALAIGFALGLAVGLVGGLVPANKVRRLAIIDFMR